MTLDSIVTTRLFLWHVACEAWGFDIEPPFSSASLAGLAPGEIRFHARRTIGTTDAGHVAVTLHVAETWRPGEDPYGDRRHEADGCHVDRLGWHVQVGASSGESGAERLDVCHPDEVHPRVHSHPLGQHNDVRLTAELPPPGVWLQHVGELLGEAFDDGLAGMADEED